MSLVVALGSNLGDRQANLRQARESLLKHFQLIKFSSILESAPVDYFDCRTAAILPGLVGFVFAPAQIYGLLKVQLPQPASDACSTF